MNYRVVSSKWRIWGSLLALVLFSEISRAQTPSPSMSPPLDTTPPPYPYRNTTLVEQYASVLVGRQVRPRLTSVPPSSGLVYFTAERSGSELRVYSTIWHNVESATSIMLHGPALSGSVGDPIVSLVPSAGSAVPASCPIERTFLLSSQMIETLRSGLMYVQIESATDPNGKVRGQIESRNDIYISFALAIAPVPSDVEEAAGFFVGAPPAMHPRNTFIPVGMAIIHLGESNNPERVVMNSWIMLRAANEPIVLGIDNDNGEILNTFGTHPPRPPTIPTMIIFNETSIKKVFVIRRFPLFGPNSSRLALAVQSANGTSYKLGPFERLPLVSETTDPKFGGREGPKQKGSGSGAKGSGMYTVSGLTLGLVIMTTLGLGFL